MGFFSKKRTVGGTVTAQEFGLELSRYAQEFAKQGQRDIAQALGVRPKDIISPELVIFHHWGAQVQIGHLELDEPTTIRVLDAMVDAFVVPMSQMGMGITAEGAKETYGIRMVEYQEAFEPVMRMNSRVRDPFFRITSLLCTNLTGDTESGGWLAKQRLVPYLQGYLGSSRDFIEKFQVTES